MSRNKTRTIVALENIRSLYNIGAIYRTCEFFGVKEIVLIGYSGIDKNEADGIHRKLAKTSLGSINKIKTHQIDAVEKLPSLFAEIPVIAIENNVEGVKPVYDWEPPENCILLFGNEVDGLTQEAINLSNEIIEIPRIGTHQSLNVTTACGIVLSYLRQNIK